MGQKEKRVCMVVHAYYPLGEVRVQRESEALLQQGYKVDVIALRGTGETDFDTHNGVNIYRLPVKRTKSYGMIVQLFEYLLFFLAAFFKLTWLHFKYHYHVVQVHNLPDFLVFTAIIPKLMGTPIILDLHDLMPEFFAARSGREREHFTVRLVYLQERLACRFANHVITVTEYWRQSLINRGLPPDKCSVVMNLADPRIFKRPTQVPPKAPDQFQLIYHGAIPYRYGLDLVIKAMSQLRSEIPTLSFKIIGTGDHLDDLKQLTRDLDLQDSVVFIPPMQVELIPAQIITADCAVTPYRDDVFTRELLPTKLLEYAALGIPAIAAKTLGISSCFDTSMIKYFSPNNIDELADAIRYLYHNPDELHQLTENIKKFNTDNNWQKTSAEYVALVGQLRQVK